MIQSGLLPNTLATIDQLDDPRKGNWWSNRYYRIREMKITPWIVEWNARRRQSCNGYSYVYGARFEEQHIG
jgi:hypothetical protein